jgi:peptidoglycan/LPS O-acetylase OafA/YrhL
MAAVLLLAVRARVSAPIAVAVLAAAGLAWNCVVPGGWVTGFFLEYWVHFALGALLFYVLCVYPARASHYSFLGAVIALGVYSAARIFPWEPQTPSTLRVYTEFVVVCGFVLFLYLARPLSAAVARSWVWKPIAALGAISYSLYLIHQFNLRIVAEMVNSVLPHAWGPIRVILLVALEILLASLFWYLCERPFLNSASRNKAAAPAGGPRTFEAAG